MGWKQNGGKIVKDKFHFAPGELVVVFQDCFGNELTLWEN
jgi:predicted enzyme related to lactoylglutathione lyase